MYDASPPTNKLYEIYAYDGPTWTLPPDVSVRRPLPSCAFGHVRIFYKFTGKERDSESNLDNFGARYYTSTVGRFMTPDWAAKPVSVPYAKFGDPQTLNLYAYVENSPLTRIDADGHCGSGPNNPPCEQVKIEAKVEQNPTFAKNVPLKDKEGNVVVKKRGQTERTPFLRSGNGS